MTTKPAITAAMMGSRVIVTERAEDMDNAIDWTYFAVRFAMTSLTMEAAEKAFGQPA
jgi:hypothetical protein